MEGVLIQGEETVHGATQVLVQAFVLSGCNTVTLQESLFLMSKNLLLFCLLGLTFSIAHLEYTPTLVFTSSHNTTACGLRTVKTNTFQLHPVEH